MIIHNVTIRNYRPFRVLKDMKLGQLGVLVGKNDAGKSSILRAIRLFFEKRPKIDESDVHDHSEPDDDVVVEIAFASLPETIEVEEGIQTTLQDEMLLDGEGNLRIRKTYPRGNLPKFRITLMSQDYLDDTFGGLANLKETELNGRCKKVGIDVTKAGRGYTNQSKREALRTKAKEMGKEIGECALELSPKGDLWKCTNSLLPDFDLFESETKTDVSETSFQSPFRPIVKTAAERPEVKDARAKFTRAIEEALQKEVDKIFERFQRHTDAIDALRVEPTFSWDKAVFFQLYGKDAFGIDKPLEKRGSGLRRLLMVAFFEYLAHKREEDVTNFIFGIEEPENDLHPGLQRELTQSLRQLADSGYQILITSHSPVFAGASPIEDLTLITRKKGIARAIQHPELDLGRIAAELGVEPADQITGYDACVFVEGKNDIMFWREVASALKESGHTGHDFEDKRIGFIPVGGSNLKCWIAIRAMKRLNRRFGCIVDSDRKCQTDSVPQKKLCWKSQCEEDGGTFIILRKREIENYLHSSAIERSGRTLHEYDDFTDMKELFGAGIIEVIRDTSSEEILAMDRYAENGGEHHELKETVETLLALVE
ncbi:MAG: AAA family ATPase [Thermoplasmata archaeon]|nr:AAA family ATPase [Thermoplasmata archaeon]